MADHAHFFAWQIDRLGTLLAWGAANIAVGAGLSIQRRPLLRRFGWQAISWGAIDALLAWNGSRAARSRLHHRQPATSGDIHGFRRILAINAALDALYIAFGWLFQRHARDDRDRGTGLGVLMQGLFLLIFDWWLLRESRRFRAG